MPIDAAGKEHFPAGSRAGIVSLVPSLTELLFDLGLDKQLLGRTSDCVEPVRRVDAITVVGSVKAVDLMKLAELGPSHVLVNIDDTPETLVQEIVNLGVEVVVTHCNGPEDIMSLLDLLGSLFDREERAGTMAATLQREIQTARQAAEQRPVRNVVYLTWKNPWLSVRADSYTANMLALVGLSIMTGDGAARMPELKIDQAFLSSVHLVLFGDEPFQFEDEDVQDFQLDYKVGSIPHLALVESRALTWAGRRAADGLRELSQLAAQI